LILGFLALSGVILHAGPRRWLYLLGPLLAVGVALLAGARSAIVAFPVLAVLAALLLVRRRIAAAVIAVAALVVFAGFIVVAVIGRDSRVNSLFEIARSVFGGGAVADTATQQRFALYRAGAQVFEQSPLLGVGWHERMRAVTAALPEAQRALGGLPHLHNEVLNFAVGSGGVGVAVYLLLLLAPLLAVARSPRDSQFRARLYTVAILVAGYILLGLADVMVGFETHTALYVAWTAVLLAYCQDGGRAAV
jgi:O-antigen ligase